MFFMTSFGCTNMFQSVLHMVGREVVDGKPHRKWDRAQTPYQRLLASGVLSPEHQTKLVALYSGTNPRQLRTEIYQALENLWERSETSNGTNRKKEVALLPVAFLNE
jgi:hypothetical protein